MDATCPTTRFTEQDEELFSDWLEGRDHLHDMCNSYNLSIRQVAPTSCP